MRIFKNFGMTLLAIWLIVTGLLHFVHVNYSGMGTVMAVIALVAGILILVGR